MTTDKKQIAKTSQIRINVHLNEENLPLQLDWDADDADFEGQEPAKGMMLSIFDGFRQNSMRIDLWTQDMNVEEMNLFMFQTLATMADTFEKATGNKALSDEMRDFVHNFGHKANVFGPDHKH